MHTGAITKAPTVSQALKRKKRRKQLAKRER